jgi:hypothetical protein
LLANLDNRLFTYKVNAYLGCGQNYNTPKQQLSSGNFCTVKPLLPAQCLCAPFPPRRPSGFSRLVPLALLLLLLRSGRLEGCGIQPGSAGFLVPFAPEGPLRCGPSGGALGAGGARNRLSASWPRRESPERRLCVSLKEAKIRSEDQKRRSEAKTRSEFAPMSRFRFSVAPGLRLPGQTGVRPLWHCPYLTT